MNKTLSLISACVLCTGGLLTSCSEETLDSVLSLPDGTPSSATIGFVDEIHTIPVKSDGEWTATVVYDRTSNSEDNSFWLGLLDNSGKGDSEISYIADANNTASVRNAKIVLVSGDKTLEYPVTQLPFGSGDDNDDMDMSKFSKQIPIGTGLRMTNSKNEKLKNILLGQVYTLHRLNYKSNIAKDIIEKFRLEPEIYYSSSTETDIDLSLHQAEEMAASSRLIGANLKVNVGYGIFKLNLNGDFRMFGSSNDSIVTFSAASSPVLGDFELNEDILNRAVSLIKESSEHTEKEKDDAMRLIFSNGFIEVRDSIEKLVASGAQYSTTNPDRLLAEMFQYLDNNYGPAYIRSVDMGGTAELVYSTKYTNAVDTMNIHGDLTLGLNAVLKFDATASADYISKMQSRMKENSFRCRIKGGNMSEANSLLNKFGELLKPDSTVDPATIAEQLNSWVNSLTMDNATCVDYHPVPIWNLFSSNAQKQLMRFFYDRYPNNEDGNCPYPFDVRAQIVNDTNWPDNK